MCVNGGVAPGNTARARRAHRFRMHGQRATILINIVWTAFEEGSPAFWLAS